MPVALLPPSATPCLRDRIASRCLLRHESQREAKLESRVFQERHSAARAICMTSQHPSSTLGETSPSETFHRGSSARSRNGADFFVCQFRGGGSRCSMRETIPRQVFSDLFILQISRKLTFTHAVNNKIGIKELLRPS